MGVEPPPMSEEAPRIESLTAELTQWLADNGFPPDGVNHSGVGGGTPLLRASKEGNLPRLRELAAAGAALDATDSYGNNAIWLACASDAIETIDFLVAAGVDVNHSNADGATALIYASSAGKAAFVERLLRLGADPAPVTVDGFSALDLASTRECLDLLRGRKRIEAPAK